MINDLDVRILSSFFTVRYMFGAAFRGKKESSGIDLRLAVYLEIHGTLRMHELCRSRRHIEEANNFVLLKALCSH